MLVASHVKGVHATDAIVAMPASATVLGVLLQTVHKVGLVEQASCHLHRLETMRENLVYLVASDQAAKLRAARARQAELERREAELLRSLEDDE